MSEELKLHKPWLIAVWPGMGNVAITAGYYMMPKLGMHLLAEFSPKQLFEIEHVDVVAGKISPGKLPRSRLFAWSDPQHQHDIIVFIGEAQPSVGKYLFCHSLIDLAAKMGVERVFTFAAMATDMHPAHFSRVFGASTDDQGLEQLRSLDIELLEDGRIGGLNGVLLGVAAERGMSGSCLLGEMPHLFTQLPFPKASLAVLRVFTSMLGIDLDTHELAEQANAMDENLGHLLSQMENAISLKPPDGDPADSEEDDNEMTSEFLASDQESSEQEQRLSSADQRKIEQLFEDAMADRSKTYELKRELDRLNVFKKFENRFLDLFRKPRPSDR